MNKMTSKERLERYIKEDSIYQEYLDNHKDYVSDFDKFCVQHCQDIKNILEENEKLKKQLEYLRSGEYFNQLRFERNMLQNIVDNSEISKEDKEFIDMTHRNTELLEENKKLKSNYERIYNENCKLREKHNINDISLLDENEELKNQQKEFVKYLTDTIKNLECDVEDDEELRGYLIQRRDTFKEILSKYKEIIGGENE